jgi:carbon-monoxide dehydrogenase large subunit
MNAPHQSGGLGAARYTGQRVPRKEDGRLLTGRGTFVDDVNVPGTQQCAFVRSPIAKGRILSIDTSVAKTLPGVVAVLTMADLDQIPVTLLNFFFAPMEVETTLLARDRVAHVGDPVVLVIAQDRYLAEDAAALVAIEYDEEDPVVTIADAMTGAKVHPDAESNVSAIMGDPEVDEELAEKIAGAAHVITRKIIHQRISQSPMETRGILSHPIGDEELTIYVTCQSPSSTARFVQQALERPNMSVRIIAKDVGGSFGYKNTPFREEMAVVVASMILRRPLKWIEDRLECLTASTNCREQEMTMQVAFDAKGHLVAGHGDYHSNNGAYPLGADPNVAVHVFIWSAHKMPHYEFCSRGWYSNTQGLSAYRGPWALESLARETVLDVAARQMGIDPIELRRRNLLYLSDQPVTNPFGMVLEDVTPGECLEKLLENFDVPAFRKEQAEARKEGRYLGLGIATYIEPTGTAGSMPAMTGETAQLRIEPNGKVTALMGTHSQGHGTATTMAQLIADHLGVPYEDVTVFEGDSSRGGYGPGAAGSRQGVIGGGASIGVARVMKDKIKRLAAHLLNANPDDVDIVDGMVRVAGAEEMTRSLREIAEIAYGEPARLPHGLETGLEASYRYDPPPITFTSAAHACTVEVDAETGFVKILRWISSEDCGNVINPAVVEGQIAGGLAQAIGSVLLEDFHYDSRGNPTTATFKDYLLPAISDVPDFEYIHANTPSKTEGGFRGVGEGGAIVGPPTLFNAIADALSPFGEVPITLPLTPSRLLDVMDGKSEPEPMVDTASIEDAGPEATSESPGPSAALAGVDPEEFAGASVKADGEWSMILASPVGPQPMTAFFQTEGSALTGRLESPEGTQEFAGTVEGNRIKWEMKVTKPMSITLKYDLTFEGDEISGKCKMGMFGSSKVTGTRVIPEGQAPTAPAAAGPVDKAPVPTPAAETPAAAPSAPAAGPVKVDGEWSMILASPVGPKPMTGFFQTDGSALTGRLESPDGTQEFAGTVDGGRVKWEMKVTKPMPITLKYDLTVEGDEISGKCKMGMFGSSKVTGTRV